MVNNKVNLKELFLKRQKELLSSLDRTRSVVQHPGTMGDASELDWIGMLEKYLPTRYAVGKAFVVDSHGDMSEQQDVVIYDSQFSPRLLNEKGVLYVPSESVYAVLEVKQDINKPYIEYAGKKIASVRRLRRTSVAISHAGGRFPPKDIFPILGGLLTLSSSWKPPLGKRLDTALAGLAPDERVDIGCALTDGSFEATYKDDGTVDIDRSQPDTALIFFFMRLVHRLQQLGTVPALDLLGYGQTLEQQ